MVDSNMSQWDTFVLRAVRHAAKRSYTAQRGFVELDDLMQEGFLYALENREKVQRWLDDGDGVLLQHALYQHLHKYTMRERYAKDGTKPSDYYTYQTAVIAELLPEVYMEDGAWGTSPSDLSNIKRSSRSLAEGGDRMAMVADVKAGVATLPEPDALILQLKYEEGGRTDEEVAEELGIPEVTVNKAVARSIRKIAKTLGSEPVRRRRSISNAQAQHITGEQA